MAFDKQAYDNAYSKEHYTSARVVLLKEDMPKVKQLAKNQGVSVSQLFINALKIAYGLNVSKD